MAHDNAAGETYVPALIPSRHVAAVSRIIAPAGRRILEEAARAEGEGYRGNQRCHVTDRVLLETARRVFADVIAELEQAISDEDGYVRHAS